MRKTKEKNRMTKNSRQWFLRYQYWVRVVSVHIQCIAYTKNRYRLTVFFVLLVIGFASFTAAKHVMQDKTAQCVTIATTKFFCVPQSYDT